jgi:REP element-mobilizing transposase RayT
MARPLRIEFPGGLYHITCRGNGGKDIFIDDHDRVRFMEYLKKNTAKHNVIMYAYCLMSNHYHLFSETMKANLSRFMHAINTSYTVYFNRRHQRIGHLFQGRYKAIIVDKDAYLLELCRYIHLNPVRAGIVSNPAEYRWSSHRAYLGIDKRNDLIDPDIILPMFSTNRRKAVRRYRTFVNESTENENPLKRVVGQVILGKDEFIQNTKERINIRVSVPEISSLREIKGATPKDVFGSICEEFNILEGELKRKKKNCLPRKLAMYLLKNYTTLPLRTIGEMFNTGYANVSITAKKTETLIAENPVLKERVERMLENLKLKT